jgi:sugar phosphate isomerase/epimerase
MFDSSIVCAYLYIITRYGYPPDAAETEQYLKEMKQLGFQSVELEGIREKHLAEVYDLRHTIQSALTDLHLQVPYFCAVLPGLTSIDRDIRRRNLELFEQGCETARLFRARGILDNAPVPPYRFPDDIPVSRHYDQNVIGNAVFPENVNWTDYWDLVVKIYREVCDIAGRYNLTYQVHPAVGCLAATTDGFLNLQKAVSRDNLRFNFDTANLFTMKENISLSLLRLGSSVDYIHLSDNDSSRIEHTAPGTGKIQWEVFFESVEQIGFNGHIGLDIGGEESHVDDLDRAYIDAAEWLTEHRNYKV